MEAQATLEQARDAYLNLVRVHDRLSTQFNLLFRQHGLTQAQYNVLRILLGGDADGLSCQVIGKRLIHRLPDVTRLIDRMQANGLVERQRSSTDRRVVLVRITQKGADLCREVTGPVDELHRQQFAHMPPDRLEAWSQGLLEILGSA